MTLEELKKIRTILSAATGLEDEDQEIIGAALKALDALIKPRTTKPAAPVQVDAWPCVIAEADFEQDTITLKMQCSDYKVGAGQHWLHTTKPAAQPAPSHPDDLAVDRFAVAMKDKLAKAREKGRSGWETCPPDDLSRMLREHVGKGDPRDVANFAMMLWSLGAGIAATPPAAQPAVPDAITDNSEDPDYRAGWNECRETMLQILKARTS